MKNTRNGSCEDFYAKAQEIEGTLSCIKEDYPSHKLLLRHLEQLDSASNYKWDVKSCLQHLRDHLRKFLDNCRHPYFFNGESITIDKTKILVEHQKLRETIILDSYRPFIYSELHESCVEDVDFSDSKSVDPEGFKDFVLSGSHSELSNNMFKFKLCPQCGCCGKRHFGGANQYELRDPVCRTD